jgi:hypothetical protein
MGILAEELATSAAQLAPKTAQPLRAAAPFAECLRFDPFTSRMICEECWNCKHGTRKSPVCKVRECHCGCKDAWEVRRKERVARTAAQEQRKALEREMLEAKDNPLRAYNPDYQEP